MRVLLAGGGTAGHTSPLLATADALRRLDPDVEITCLGTPRGPGEPGRPRGRLPARADPAGAAAAPARAPTCSGCRAGCAARSEATAARCSTGSGPTWSSASAATSRCRPTSPPGAAGCRSSSTSRTPLPGLANKAGARVARRVAVSFPDTPLPQGRVRRPADPPDDLHARPRPRCAPRPGAFFGLDPDRPTLLVTGGSQGARRLNQAVSGAARGARPTPGVQVLHVVGPEGRGDPRARPACPTSCVPFVDRMDLAYAAADLVRLPGRRQQRHRGRRGRAARRSSCRCRSATASRRSTPARSSTPGERCWSTTRRSRPSGCAATVPGAGSPTPTGWPRWAPPPSGADPARRRRASWPAIVLEAGGRR